MRALIILEILLSILNTLGAVIKGLQAGWWRLPMGRHLMVYSGAWALELVGLVFLGLGVPWPLWVYAIVFGVVLVATSQRSWLILRSDLRERDEQGS